MQVQEKFAEARAAMKAALIERDEEIDLALTAMVAREHVLLVGPPGVAKSALANSLGEWMHGEVFPVHLNKDTARDAIFGPIDAVAYAKERKYERFLQGSAVTADVLILEEVFKAGPAVLDMLLLVLNERVYREGLARAECKLKFAIGTSNEWAPEGCEAATAAFFDRFLFRKTVRPIATEEGNERLFWERDHTPKFTSNVTAAEIDQACSEAADVRWTDEAKEALRQIRRQLAHEGIVPSDRRKYKAFTAAQAYAYLDGSSEITTEHLEILSHVLWDDPKEQPKKAAEVISKVANPTSMAVNGLMLEVQEILGGNMGNMQVMIAATKKLQSVAGKLRKIKTPKAKQSLAYVEGKLKDLLVGAVSGGLV